MASSASSVARSSVSDDSSLGHETISMDCTEAPQGMTISEVLLDRRWTFEEVLFIKGASTNLSRRELKETVADVKGVGEERVEVCFFDEDDLTTPVVKDQVLKAGLPKGDVVCVWCTKYAPAAHKRYSRKWVKTKKKMDSMPARWYLVTAIRKDGLLDDEADQHLSAEEVKEVAVTLSAEEEKDKTMWIPPSFDSRGILTLKQQMVKDAEDAAREKEKEKEEKAARAAKSPGVGRKKKSPRGKSSVAKSPIGISAMAKSPRDISAMSKSPRDITPRGGKAIEGEATKKESKE